ncbi:hypothetical protein DFJ73DRAFT_850115, partial [Zopfochytrium polystomum]
MMSLSSSSSSSVPPAFSNGWAEAANDDDRSSLLSSSSTLLPPPPPPPPPIIGRTSTSSSSSYIPPRTSSSPPTSSSPLDSLLQGLTYAFFLTALLGSAAFLGFASYREANAVPVVESAAKNGTTTFTAATMPFNNDTLSKLNYNMIVVSGKPTAVDPVTFSYSLSFSFTPCGDYADFALGQIGGNFPLKKDVALTIDSTTIKFKKGAIMPAKEMTFVFGNGLINDYPFDVYESNPIVMDATIKDEDGKSKKIPLDVLVSARFHSWKINVFQVEDMSGIGSPTQTYNGNTVANQPEHAPLDRDAGVHPNPNVQHVGPVHFGADPLRLHLDPQPESRAARSDFSVLVALCHSKSSRCNARSTDCWLLVRRHLVLLGDDFDRNRSMPCARKLHGALQLPAARKAQALQVPVAVQLAARAAVGRHRGGMVQAEKEQHQDGRVLAAATC